MKAKQRLILFCLIFAFLFIMLGLVIPNPLLDVLGGVFVIFIVVLFYNGMSYRPPDDCIVAVYRQGKIDRIIDSAQKILLIPNVDHHTLPISLRMRSTHLTEPEVMTRDHQIIQTTLHVYYSVDPRNAKPEFKTEELRYNDDEWENAIQREMQSVQIEVARSFYSDELLTTDGLRSFRSLLSSELTNTVKDLGIAIHETHGVRIDQLLPHRKVLQSMIEADASPSLGKAAQQRMQPLLNSMTEMPAAGWQALLIGMASAIVNHDDPQKLEAAPKFAKVVGEVKDNTGANTPPPRHP